MKKTPRWWHEPTQTVVRDTNRVTLPPDWKDSPIYRQMVADKGFDPLAQARQQR